MSVCRGCSRHEHRDFVTPRPLRSCTFMHAPKPRRGFPALPDRKCERNGQCPPASILNWYKVNLTPTEQPMDSATFIYNYCFSLYPEDRQPSGACNFSRIDNVTLRLTFPSAYNTDSAVQALPFNGQIRVLARGYNVMRIVSGMAGKLYAN